MTTEEKLAETKRVERTYPEDHPQLIEIKKYKKSLVEKLKKKS